MILISSRRRCRLCCWRNVDIIARTYIQTNFTLLTNWKNFDTPDKTETISFVERKSFSLLRFGSFSRSPKFSSLVLPEEIKRITAK
jgi:hypothetical protein